MTFHKCSMAFSRTWTVRNGIIFGSSSSPRENSWTLPKGVVFGKDGKSHQLRSFQNTPNSSTSTSFQESTAQMESDNSFDLASTLQPLEIPPSLLGATTQAKGGLVEAPSEDDNTAVTYRIPEEELQKARNAQADSPDSFWSHKLYRGPGMKKVTVHYCHKKHTTERVIRNYFLDERILGFDIEWQPSATAQMGAKKNVALVQLACENRIGLFHIALFANDDLADLVAPSLKMLMENPEVSKVGVAIRGDCTRMKTHLGMECRGAFELSHLYKLVKYSSTGTTSMINKRLVSLAAQVEEHLGLPLYKGDDVRGSDWTQELDIAQINYAAADSYAGFMLYNVMESKRKALDPTPPRPYPVELDIPIRLASGVAITTNDELPVEDPTTIISGEKNHHPPRAKKTESRSIGKEPCLSFLFSAEVWAREYRLDHPSTVYVKMNTRCPAPFPTLRAYSLWQHEKINVDEIATILKIKQSTVVAYISTAIGQEKLPFNAERYYGLYNKMWAGEKNSWRVKAVIQMARTERVDGLAWSEPENEAPENFV